MSSAPSGSFEGPMDLATMADNLAIIELVGLERLWRDTGEWDQVAEAFTADAIITTTWFQGNAREFALRSKEMAERGRHSKHPVQPIHVRIRGDRALVESRAQIQNRDVFEGAIVDTTQYALLVAGGARAGRLAARQLRGHLREGHDGARRSQPEGADRLGGGGSRDATHLLPALGVGDESARLPGSRRPARRRRAEQLRAFYDAEQAWLEGGNDE